MTLSEKHLAKVLLVVSTAGLMARRRGPITDELDHGGKTRHPKSSRSRLARGRRSLPAVPGHLWNDRRRRL